MSRSELEWISCPQCSTTFRVAISNHFSHFIADEEESEDSDFEMTVHCIACDLDFFINCYEV